MTLICIALLWLHELDWVLRTEQRIAFYKEYEESKHPWQYFYKWVSLWCSVIALVTLLTLKYSYWVLLGYMIFQTIFYISLTRSENKYSIPEHRYECLSCTIMLTFVFFNEALWHYSL